MRFDTSQHMRLNQQMKLAPRMIQSMEILQLPILALQERIEQELESNIALEQVEPGSDDDNGVNTEASDDDSFEERAMTVGESEGNSDDFERLSEMETNFRESFEYESSQFRPERRNGDRDSKMDSLASLPSRGESLIEQLQHQWALSDIDPAIAPLGGRVIEYINDDGLVDAEPKVIVDQVSAEPEFASVTEADIDRVIRELQFWLEPPGIAARTVREALLLQVDHCSFNEDTGDEPWSDVRELIDQHYDDLLENRIPRICEQMGWPIERVRDAMSLMRRITPTPGKLLVSDDVPPVVPDAAIEYDESSDEYFVTLNERLTPALRVSRRYESMSRDRDVEKDARDFAANSVRNAAWLIDAVEQRRNTLQRVVNAVIARQRDYLDKGPQHLRPMPMIDVADQLGVHVATISRAVAGKWVRTPRGIVPLRMFFSGGTSTDSGEQMSWEAVRATLKEIIEDEDKAKPHSDEALAEVLRERGIDIARRTVVKYRQQMDIPPARRRKVFESERAS